MSLRGYLVRVCASAIKRMRGNVRESDPSLRPNVPCLTNCWRIGGC